MQQTLKWRMSPARALKWAQVEAREDGHRDVPSRVRRREAARTATKRCGHFSATNVVGGYGVGVTPVPISNTAVKPHSADGTAG